MSNPAGVPSPPPGWYPDPADAQSLRWWDGVQWSAHVQDSRVPVPPAQYVSQYPAQYSPAGYGAAAAYPPLPPRAPAIPKDPSLRVYTPFIWAILALGGASVLSVALFDLTAYIGSLRFQALGGDSTRVFLFTPPYTTLVIVAVLIYAGSAVLAFLDWRMLRAAGMRAPFHWAWTFLNTGLYVIGRSIVAFRRAGRGLAPIWIWIGFMVLSLVVVFSKVAAAITEIGNYSQYTGA